MTADVSAEDKDVCRRVHTARAITTNCNKFSKGEKEKQIKQKTCLYKSKRASKRQ